MRIRCMGAWSNDYDCRREATHPQDIVALFCSTCHEESMMRLEEADAKSEVRSRNIDRCGLDRILGEERG